MKKLPILTGPQLAMLGCAALAMVIAPPLFMRDFRVDVVAPRPPLPDQMRAESDTGSELVKNPRLFETPVPYLEYLANNRAASRATGIVLDEDLLAGATTQFYNDSSVLDGGGMPAYEDNGGSAPMAARGSAGRSGISGFGGLPGVFAMSGGGSRNQPALATAAALGIPRSGSGYPNTPAGWNTPGVSKSTDPSVHRPLPRGGGRAPAGHPGTSGVGGLPGVSAMPGVGPGNQPALVTAAELAASNGLKSTADLTREKSSSGEGANEELGDAALEILQSSLVYTNTPAGWGMASASISTDPSVHRYLPVGEGAPPPSIANIGDNNGPLVPVSLTHDIIGQPLPAVEQIVVASASGGDVIMVDLPSQPLAIAPAQVLPIPEPSTVALFGVGLALLGVLTLRRKR